MRIDSVNNQMAQQVVACLRKADVKSGIVRENAWLKNYANGREQGFVLHFQLPESDGLGLRQVTFSENRNSDNVVVYFGDLQEFKDTPRGEDLYRGRKLFRSPEEAAYAILDHIRREVKEGRATRRERRAEALAEREV